jgi:hypothetical protein
MLCATNSFQDVGHSGEPLPSMLIHFDPGDGYNENRHSCEVRWGACFGGSYFPSARVRLALRTAKWSSPEKTR